MQQHSAEWHEARLGRITGTRFARIMGDPDSEGFRRLIETLVQERLTGRRGGSDFQSDAMRWGLKHEPAARRWYARETGALVEEVGFVLHPALDFVGVSPDGLVGEDGLVEIKCPQAEAFAQVAKAKRMPARYKWQVQGQLWVCEREWADFVCFSPQRGGVIVRVLRDEGGIRLLRERCIEVEDEVLRRLQFRPWVPQAGVRLGVFKTPTAAGTNALKDGVASEIARDQRPQQLLGMDAATVRKLALWLVGLVILLFAFL